MMIKGVFKMINLTLLELATQSPSLEPDMSTQLLRV